MRKDEQEIPCRILSMNDTLVTYRKWKNADTSVYVVKKYEVLSFLVEKRSPQGKEFSRAKAIENNDTDLLGEYFAGNVVPGYVITNNNDTLQGFVTIKNVALNQVLINFADSTGKSRIYTVKDAKGYSYSNLRYEIVKTGFKKNVTNKQRTNGYHFLHLAVDGPSKLYRFYTLTFKKSTMISYNENPAPYLGKLKRHFIISIPEGKQIFTKGKTLTGSLNRIYSNYPKYLSKNPVDSPKAFELPGIVNAFNYWYQNNR